MGAGQESVQAGVPAPATTVVRAVAVLSPWNSSFVELVTVAVLEIIVSIGVPGSTVKTNVKVALAFGARLGIVQVVVPVWPGLGPPQIAPVLEVSASDAKVELFGTGSLSTTLVAVSGPRLIISMSYEIPPPAVALTGPNLRITRSALNTVAGRTRKLAAAYP